MVSLTSVSLHFLPACPMWLAVEMLSSLHFVSSLHSLLAVVSARLLSSLSFVVLSKEWAPEVSYLVSIRASLIGEELTREQDFTVSA